jgi:inosine/xanthosine triphosphate pyrophosphatase family protein
MQQINIILATRNRSKLALYRDVLFGNFNVVSPVELDLPIITVEETLDDAHENAHRKAAAYKYLAPRDFSILGEDTSIEIPLLDNKPGPAVRRWCGELPDDVSDRDWVLFFKKKIEEIPGHSSIACIKKHFYSIIDTEGRSDSFSFDVQGEIRIRALPEHIDFKDGPFSYFFYLPEMGKYESELSASQRSSMYSSVPDMLMSRLDATRSS